MIARVDGHAVALGNLKMMKRQNVDLGDLEAKSETLANDGKTPMFVSVNGQAAGIIAVADTVKEDSKEAIAALHKMGIEVVMITDENAMAAPASSGLSSKPKKGNRAPMAMGTPSTL